jgi:hypothetical protein
MLQMRNGKESGYMEYFMLKAGHSRSKEMNYTSTELLQQQHRSDEVGVKFLILVIL